MTITQSEHFISSELNDTFKQALTDLRTDIGRECVLTFLSRSTDCPNCLFDDVADISTNIFEPRVPYPAGVQGPIDFTGGYCPVCSGVGLIGNIATSGIQVIVDSFRGRDQEHMVIGRRFQESFRIQADIGEYQAFLDVDTVLVDGLETEPIDIHRVGLKDLALCEVTLRQSNQDRSDVNLGLS